MKICVNEESHDVPDGSKMSDLIKFLSIEDLKGWAVALNNEVVSSQLFPVTELKTGDHVILIQATQGG
ncbi:MAG: thiamine biosynthesis protein ThiS [Verrucomicrobia bacterium TMED56]|jgi:thiamine biosynthesis protein ThiS|nr:MAG: thiamine biosynthesis protein ThiS [Verrucomicrobia bacterium TMED56]